jgi:hypothetical protein
MLYCVRSYANSRCVQYHDGNSSRDEAGFKKLAATNSGDGCLVQVQ